MSRISLEWRVRFGALAILVLGVATYLLEPRSSFIFIFLFPLALLAFFGSTLALFSVGILLSYRTYVTAYLLVMQGSATATELVSLLLHLVALVVLVVACRSAVEWDDLCERRRVMAGRAGCLSFSVPHPPHLNTADKDFPPIPTRMLHQRVTTATLWLIGFTGLFLFPSYIVLNYSHRPFSDLALSILITNGLSLVFAIAALRKRAWALQLAAPLYPLWAVLVLCDALLRKSVPFEPEAGLSVAILILVCSMAAFYLTRGWLALRELAQTPPPVEKTT
jgi:hypothetical protein